MVYSFSISIDKVVSFAPHLQKYLALEDFPLIETALSENAWKFKPSFSNPAIKNEQ